MTFQQEFASWWSPSGETASEAPKVGQKAPNTSKLQLGDGRPKMLTFLRHCGCPFAEKTYLNLRDSAKEHREIDFVAISHSNQEHTRRWHESLPQVGSEPENLKLVVDDGREIYGAFGLGPSSWAHVVSPSALMAVIRLGRETGIRNRPTESGSRWQTSGNFLVDGDGVVRWGGPAARADDIPDFENAVAFLDDGGAKAGASE